LGVEPYFHIIEGLFGVFQPQGHALFGAFTARLFFHGVKLRDPADRLLGNGRSL